ncbi:MAG: CHAD domain-containing protein [Marinicaulis sp.]|nr:CHAD domain-containing protein [Marinicaulis sp.]
MGSRHSKIILNLTGSPRDISHLANGRFLKAFGAKAGRWTHLSHVFYDTPDRELETQGITLRLTEGDGEIRQRVTRQSPGAMRIENHMAVLTPGARVFSATGSGEIDAAIRDCGALSPVYRITYDRWRAVIRYRVSKIEVTIDLGEAEVWRHGRRINRGPVNTLALKMAKGEREDLFDFARLLTESAGVRLSPQSKRDQARALAAGAQILIGKMPTLSLTGDETAGDVLRAAIGLVAERITALPPGAIDGRDPYALYQLRVALRRFRAIERTYRPFLTGKKLRRLAKRARIVGKMLGPARDWDVFIDETIPEITAGGDAPESLSMLTAAAGGARAAAWADARDTLNTAEFHAFLIDLNEYALAPFKKKDLKGALSKPVRDFAPIALDRQRKRAVKTVRRTDQSTTDGRHRVRLALKKLRYSVQLFKSLYPKEIRSPYMTAMRETQDAYGELNDAHCAKELAHEAAAGADAKRAAGFVAGYVSVADHEAAAKTAHFWRRLEAMTPFWRADDFSVS